MEAGDSQACYRTHRVVPTFVPVACGRKSCDSNQITHR